MIARLLGKGAYFKVCLGLIYGRFLNLVKPAVKDQMLTFPCLLVGSDMKVWLINRCLVLFKSNRYYCMPAMLVFHDIYCILLQTVGFCV